MVLGIAVVFEGGLAVLAWGLGAAFGIPAFGELYLSWQDALWGVAATLPLLAGAAAALRSDRPTLRRLRETIDHLVGQLFARSPVADLAVVSALAGIGEEALFRGFLQAALTAPLGPWTAVTAASLVFGLAHFISPAYAVYAAAVGVYLGALLVVSGNLLVPVLVHALFDFVALAYLVQVRPPETRPDEDVPDVRSPSTGV